MKTNSYTDAPLAPDVVNLPVVFYSHGYTSFLSQNTVLMEHLASHGYVVFSIQHTYDSASTTFPNGDVAAMDAALSETTEEARTARPLLVEALTGRTLDARLEGALAYQEDLTRVGDRVVAKSTPTWVADRLFVHNALQTTPPASVAEIVAASNLSRVGEIGMSMGGAISGEICMIDPRCAAGVNLDGSNLPFTAFDADIPAPFLMFHSDLSANYRLTKKTPPAGTPRSFNEFSYERIANAGARSDVYRVQLRGVLHLGLSDFTHFMIPPFRDSILGGGPENIIIGAQNDFVLGFLDKHLRGVSNDFPAKQLADYKNWVLPTPNADLRAWWAAKPEAERTALEARINALKPVYPPPSPADR